MFFFCRQPSQFTTLPFPSDQSRRHPGHRSTQRAPPSRLGQIPGGRGIGSRLSAARVGRTDQRGNRVGPAGRILCITGAVGVRVGSPGGRVREAVGEDGGRDGAEEGVGYDALSVWKKTRRKELNQ